MNARIRKARLMAGVLLLALAAACAERGTSPVAPVEPVPSGPAGLARIECRANVTNQQVTCGDGTSGDSRGLILGTTQYIKLTSSNVQYDAGTEIFSFDLTVKDLIPQALGTQDGVTPHPAGVQVFVGGGPTVTAGTGTITVANSDGIATFTAPNQHYYQYSGALLGSDGILSTNETSSAKTWMLQMPSTVEGWSIVFFVSAEVPYPNGWIDVTGTPQVLQGGTRTLTATARSAFGNVISGGSFTWSSSSASVATVSSAGVVTGVAPGTATITATDGTRTGSMDVMVCHATLAVGGAVALPMPASASFCLGGGASGTEYVLIPVNTGTGNRPISVTATGIVPVFGQPNPDLVPGTAFPAFRASTPRADGSFEWRLRERERRELAGLVPPGRRSTAAARPRWNLVPGTPVVGDLMQLNVRVSTLCSNADVRTARVKAVGSHVVVLSDTTNPANGFTSSDFQDIADLFDDLVWPTLTGAFGEPGDEDGNGRIAVFFTRAVNELTPSGGAYNAGFFLSRDLYSTASCPTSNVGELIYMAAPDPSGAVNGNARSVDLVKYHAARTMGHELQHLGNASYRLLYTSGRLEEAWLDEGLSGIAEEMLFYAAAGKAPKQNLGVSEVADGAAVQEAFFAYAEPNLARLRPWLQAPHAGGPADLPVSPGAAWAFLRYAADQRSDPSAFWTALTTSDTTGMVNLREALGGTDPLLSIGSFGAAMYADDALPGAATVYTQPSWNFRSLYGALDYDGDSFPDGYPLLARNPGSGAAESFTLSERGGAAYLRMGVSASGFATVSMTSNGAAPNIVVRTVVIRRK